MQQICRPVPAASSVADILARDGDFR